MIKSIKMMLKNLMIKKSKINLLKPQCNITKKEKKNYK